VTFPAASGDPAPPLYTVSSPTPISAALKQHLDDVLSQIPTGKTVLVSGGLTTTGVMGSVGVKRTIKAFDLTASGYAAKQWGAPGWEAGARASVAF